MIEIADAGYALALDDTSWLEGVLEAARPVLDHGTFIHGYVIDTRVRSVASIQMPAGADFERHVRHAHPPPGDPDIGLTATPANLITSSQLYGVTGPELARRCYFPDDFGIVDSVALSAGDPSGIACLLVGGLHRVARFSRRDQAAWSRVASHLAAAMRLRERYRAAPHEASLDAADALLDPRTFRVEDVNGDLAGHRTTIRNAASVLATRHQTIDPEKLVAAWRALVAGRWSLIDTFDTDGKRFFVLRKNEPTAPGPEALVPLQRAIAAYIAMGHSNKAIAYHLGLSESTVSRIVTVICELLGVGHREQLAQLASALGAHPEGNQA